MNDRIPTNWRVNALLLAFIAAVSYGIFLAIMVGTNASPEQPQHPGVVLSENPPTSQT